jgi:hypothetical protein
VRTFSTASRRPHGAARAADAAPWPSLALTLRSGRANAGRLARKEEFPAALVTRSFHVHAGLLPVRHCPRRPEPSKSAYGVLRIGCADS